MNLFKSKFSASLAIPAANHNTSKHNSPHTTPTKMPLSPRPFHASKSLFQRGTNAASKVLWPAKPASPITQSRVSSPVNSNQVDVIPTPPETTSTQSSSSSSSSSQPAPHQEELDVIFGPTVECNESGTDETQTVSNTIQETETLVATSIPSSEPETKTETMTTTKKKKQQRKRAPVPPLLKQARQRQLKTKATTTTTTTAKRHAHHNKSHRAALTLVTDSAIQRLKYKAGVPRISAAGAVVSRAMYMTMLEVLLRQAAEYKNSRQRKTLEVSDIVAGATSCNMRLLF